jgi:hypothetical protein
MSRHAGIPLIINQTKQLSKEQESAEKAEIGLERSQGSALSAASCSTAWIRLNTE